MTLVTSVDSKRRFQIGVPAPVIQRLSLVGEEHIQESFWPG